MAEVKKLKQPDPELLKNLELIEQMEMMEMLVDTGIDKKMKPVSDAKGEKK